MFKLLVNVASFYLLIQRAFKRCDSAKFCWKCL